MGVKPCPPQLEMSNHRGLCPHEPYGHKEDGFDIGMSGEVRSYHPVSVVNKMPFLRQRMWRERKQGQGMCVCQETSTHSIMGIEGFG